MKAFVTLLLAALSVGAQGGLGTPTVPPPGPRGGYRPVAPYRPVFPPYAQAPLPGYGYNPLIVPYWSWDTGRPRVNVTNVTVVEAPPAPVPPIPPLHPAHLSTAAAAKRRAEVAATVVERTELTLTLPATGTVWLDGVKQAGDGPDFVLGVPPGKMSEVRAEWAANGATMEYQRTITLAAGEKQAVAVFRGDVKQ